MAHANTNTGYRHIDVAPVAGALGAEVRGADISTDLPDEVVADIRQALLDHQVYPLAFIWKTDYWTTIRNVLEDAKVAKSRIVFATDGSEVVIDYKAGSNAYPDCGRKRREGSRGILNAFELKYIGP